MTLMIDREKRGGDVRTATFWTKPLVTFASAPRAAGRCTGSDGTTGTMTELSNRALALVLMASFMVVLDFSIVNVALPSIRGKMQIRK